MGKLNIHRDQPQPSDEELLKHKDFEAVLNGAKVTATSASNSTHNFWSNPFIWGGLVVAITVSIIVWNMNPSTDEIVEVSNKEKPATAVTTDSTTASVIMTEDDKNKASNKIEQTNSTITNEKLLTQKEHTDVVKDSSNTTPTNANQIQLSEPDGKVFKLSSDFNLTANFKEFESYSQVSFQPLEKINPSYLETAWDSAFLQKKEAQYELILHKNSKKKIFKVKPTL
jgi:hypothetical protein